MTKFVPYLKPHLLVFYFKILEAWTVVFGPNTVWTKFEFDSNFKFTLGPQVNLPSFSLVCAHYSLAIAAHVPFVAAAVPTTCLRARTHQALKC
jgi:hypothetical protein